MAMYRKCFVAAVSLACLSSTAAADANSLTDYFGPREISVGESMRADAQGSLATNLNPAGLGLTRNVVFEGSYGYRPGDSASVLAASACDSTVPLPGCFYYRYFGAEPTIEGQSYSRRVHEMGYAAGRAITPRFLIGVNVRYFDYESDLMGEKNSSGFGGDAGAIVRVTSGLQVAAVGYNLVSTKDSAQYPMGVGGGITLRPLDRLSAGVDGVWDLDTEGKTGRYGGGLEYFFQSEDRMSGFPVRAGGVYDRARDATYVTAGLGFMSLKAAIDVGARKQVDGGDELLIEAGLRVFGPNLP